MKGRMAGQIALAWLLPQRPDVVPIPGTKRRKYLEENMGAMEVVLSGDDMARMEAIAPKDAAAGARYPEAMPHMVNI